MEGILVAALSSIIISLCIALFQKPKKMLHAKIQMGILILIVFILGIGMLSCLIVGLQDSPEAAIIIFLIIAVLEFFIVKRILRNYNMIKNKVFDEKQKPESNLKSIPTNRRSR